jgi:drug/metabolite transporter (DMT)-like permease
MAGDPVQAWSVSPQTWLAAAVSGVLYYGLAFWFYLTGLRHVSASVAGSFITLVPVFGVGAGHLAGERLTAQQWLGAIVVTIAIAVVTAQQSTPDDARSRPAPGQPPSGRRRAGRQPSGRIP